MGGDRIHENFRFFCWGTTHASFSQAEFNEGIMAMAYAGGDVQSFLAGLGTILGLGFAFNRDAMRNMVPSLILGNVRARRIQSSAFSFICLVL